MKWTMVRKGKWTATDGTNTADTLRMREGMIGCSEWMWFTEVNGEHIVNADTLRDAKAAVAAHLNTEGK